MGSILGRSSQNMLRVRNDIDNLRILIVYLSFRCELTVKDIRVSFSPCGDGTKTQSHTPSIECFRHVTFYDVMRVVVYN